MLNDIFPVSQSSLYYPIMMLLVTPAWSEKLSESKEKGVNTKMFAFLK